MHLAENFGPNDLRLATTLNDLGLLYRAEGKFKDAEPLYRRSLAIRENKLGASNPAVAVSLNNLAGLLAAENRYVEAEQKYRRALAIREKALGPDNPQVAIVLNKWPRRTAPRANWMKGKGIYMEPWC